MEAPFRKAITGLFVVLSAGTLLVIFLDLRFAYASRDVHIGVETLATLVAILAAALFYARVADTGDRTDLLIMMGLALLAASNMGRLLAPPDSTGTSHLTVWLPLTGRVLAAATLTAAAFSPRGRVRSPRPPWVYLAGGGAVAGGVIAIVALVAGDLATGIDASISPADPGRAEITGSGALIGTQTVVTLLFLAAAAGFALRAERSGEELLGWLSAAMLLGAFARFHYLLFPSVYSDWLFTGDILFLASYLTIFAGAMREIIANQRAATSAAILEERTRIARDLHDGLAQDLAYVSMQAQRMPDGDGRAGRIVEAAQGALAQSRSVIANLRLTDVALGEAATTVARTLASRHDIDLTLKIDESVEVPEDKRDDLLRIMSEAIVNAVRHGEASHLEVELARLPHRGLRLRVSDDGRGFAVDGREHLGFGLRGMRERVERLGGELDLSSSPDDGTVVEVVL